MPTCFCGLLPREPGTLPTCLRSPSIRRCTCLYMYAFSILTLHPTNIAWLKLSGNSPMGLIIPPRWIKIMLESNPLRSTMLVGRLGVCIFIYIIVHVYVYLVCMYTHVYIHIYIYIYIYICIYLYTYTYIHVYVYARGSAPGGPHRRSPRLRDGPARVRRRPSECAIV